MTDEPRSQSTPRLSVVVPAYNEERNLPKLAERIADVCDAQGIPFELVFVDDGSADGTVRVIADLAARDCRVRGIVLSRNFGHQAAIATGLQHARGDAIAVMDADLQDRPEDLVRLYARWREGVDVVYAVRRSRKEGVLLRAAYKTFYRILARVSGVTIPLDAGDFCVMSAEFVGRLNALPERLRFVRGLRAWLGGVQVGVQVDRDARHAGTPQYTFGRLVRLAIDGIVSFSDAPLKLASLAGAVVSAFAFLGVIVVLIWRALGLLPSGAGLATIALSVLFLGGVQLLTIGVLGEYIGRIFDEVKRRPIAVVARTIEREGARG